MGRRRSDAKSTRAARATISAEHAPAIAARVHEGLPLVHALAARAARFYAIDSSDLVASGNLGLVEAARSFQERAGVPFEVWALIRIRGAILDGLRAEGPRLKIVRNRPGKAQHERVARLYAGIAAAIELGVVAASSDPRDPWTPSAEEALIDAEDHRALRRAVARLPPVERSIIEHHYLCDATLADASHVVGASKSWVSRLHAQALRRLRRELARASAPRVERG